MMIHLRAASNTRAWRKGMVLVSSWYWHHGGLATLLGKGVAILLVQMKNRKYQAVFVITHEVDRNCGHPWYGKTHYRINLNGWDGLNVIADTRQELTDFIAAASKKYWKVWIEGTIQDGSKKPAAYLYKLVGVQGPWEDALINGLNYW